MIPAAQNVLTTTSTDLSDIANIGCTTRPLPPPGWSLGTFSYIDAVYGPDNDNNFLCNGLSHGGLWVLTKACYTDLQGGFLNSGGTVFGYVSGNRGATTDLIYAINNYTGTCSLFEGGSAPLSKSFYPGLLCCDYFQCSAGCQPWLFQTAKAGWKAMCDNGYAYPNTFGDIIPSSSWATGAPSFTNAQDQAFRTAHRAIRQAVLNSYNAAVKNTNVADDCTSKLQRSCSQTSNCNPTSTGCFPETLQVACVEPKYFNQTFPTYTVYLWGDAVPGSDGRTASVTCPSSPGMAAQLMSAAMGPVNTFDVTVNAGPQYSTVACSGSTCNLDISYFARTYGGLSSPAGQFLKVVVKCACGPGYQAMTPAANSSSSGNNTSSTGSASLTCVPCGAGWYRDASMGDCAPCPLGYHQSNQGQTACLPCPAGAFANKTGTANCTLCAVGTFSTAVAAGNSSLCQSCPINTYTKVNGSTACTACALGWYTNSTGTGSNCTACEPGTYRDASMQACAACPDGTYSSRGNSSCSPVPPGSCGSSTDVNDHAEQCGWGTYTSTANVADCIVCNSSYPSTARLGANDSNACMLASETSVSAVNWTDTAQAAYPNNYKTYNADLCAKFVAAYGGNFSEVGNGFCNQGPYNVALCNWDGGDCCADTCVPATYFDYGSNSTMQYAMSCATGTLACWKNIDALHSSGGSQRIAAQAAASVKCLFNTPAKTKGGKCGTKNPRDKRLGNGVCDDDLNTGDGVCAYDKGDCCVGSCVRNLGIARSCTLYTFNCRDPRFAGTSKDIVPPTLPTKLGALVFHARSRLERNKPIPVVATDNDPCFSGVAYATIVSKEDMRRTKACTRHTYEYIVRATITAKDPAGNEATKKDVRVFMVDDIPPSLRNVPLANTSVLIPGPSSRPPLLKLLIRNGPIPVLQREGRRRMTKIELSKVTTAQLAALAPEKAASIDDHPCHEDKVTFKEIKGVSLVRLNKELVQAYVPPADRKRVIDFYAANSAAGAGNQQVHGAAVSVNPVLRIWAVTDPAGNSDSVLQLLAVTPCSRMAFC
uniref:Tyrosine-protein kinase ephrin type A/B receptor-like domain-containing protein n=1 Tax=Tetradesmus obliquus TaxID=3088 RepID=A0A383VDG6_TETOB|eukprot:jgi/Sobl393_1/17032/SZX62694.1